MPFTLNACPQCITVKNSQNKEFQNIQCLSQTLYNLQNSPQIVSGTQIKDHLCLIDHLLDIIQISVLSSYPFR